MFVLVEQWCEAQKYRRDAACLRPRFREQNSASALIMKSWRRPLWCKVIKVLAKAST